ncbi:hypothetical protein L484_008892 [Morus notabilis]|uniref:Uncharacterized protein n=1 Tax=Morus notabilis TaxID=981085 RepID=W9QWT3_9ROSA|nr:hypothetical protein L484_008892 [Morus notabilis]
MRNHEVRLGAGIHIVNHHDAPGDIGTSRWRNARSQSIGIRRRKTNQLENAKRSREPAIRKTNNSAAVVAGDQRHELTSQFLSSFFSLVTVVADLSWKIRNRAYSGSLFTSLAVVFTNLSWKTESDSHDQ